MAPGRGQAGCHLGPGPPGAARRRRQRGGRGGPAALSEGPRWLLLRLQRGLAPEQRPRPARSHTAQGGGGATPGCGPCRAALPRALLLSERTLSRPLRAAPQRRPGMAAAAGRNREASSGRRRAGPRCPIRRRGREADAPGPQRGRITAALPRPPPRGRWLLAARPRGGRRSRGRIRRPIRAAMSIATVRSNRHCGAIAAAV